MLCLKAETADIAMTPVPVVLERVGEELSRLSAQVDRLQDGLAPSLLQIATVRPHAMAEIQGLDALAQTLASLADFVSSLGLTSWGDQAIAIGDLADRLPLSDLADRLRGHGEPVAAEDFELF